MQRKAIALAAAATGVASIAVGTAPASAATTAKDYAWVYSQQNFGGQQYGLSRWEGTQGRIFVGFNINSVINQSNVGTLCGFSDPAGGVFYGFTYGHTFNYVGSPFSSVQPMRYVSWKYRPDINNPPVC